MASSVYSMVLFGCQNESYDWLAGRHTFHNDFLRRVRVHGSSTRQFKKSGETVVVSHEQYIRIVHNHAPSLQQPETAAGTAGDIELDAHARAITQFIRCRLKEEDADENALFLVTAQHLTIARALTRRSCSSGLMPHSAWVDLIERTAQEFGYFFQLADDYNIEIHAELQYYEQDLVTWTLGSSPLEVIE
ncbi:hypothetical protein BD410DRAFT_843423 [Rickenella mellea]|uniref:Uncharacterized protein n=1 Tax=Rickenella mellea TaxID=50990 RepID=A0A4Y7PRQ1_9AGAM|nr:hypothetical protein BD410DRAFT_843423 [Rickenella mellea]